MCNTAALSCRSSALTGVCLPALTRRDPEDGGASGGVGVVFLCRDVVLLCFVFEKIKLEQVCDAEILSAFLLELVSGLVLSKQANKQRITHESCVVFFTFYFSSVRKLLPQSRLVHFSSRLKSLEM